MFFTVVRCVLSCVFDNVDKKLVGRLGISVKSSGFVYMGKAVLRKRDGGFYEKRRGIGLKDGGRRGIITIKLNILRVGL